MATTIIRAIARRAGPRIVRTIERAADNFARVRGADLLAGNVPSWVRRVLQNLIPSTLATDLPLPFAFLIDVAFYAVGDELFHGGGPVTDYYMSIIEDLNRDAGNFFLLGQLDEVAKFLNESITTNPDGTAIISVPPVWFRDP